MSIQITTEQIKELRNLTSISVMQCKSALEEAEGDKKKALAILKKTSSDIALKKLHREAKNGLVIIKTEEKAGGTKRAVIVPLHCETDFVSKNEDFITLLESLGDIALRQGVAKLKEKAKEMIDPIIQKTGENILLGDIFELEGRVLGSYVHSGKIAILVSLRGGDNDLAKDIAMHIAAMKPEYIRREEITEDARQTIIEVFQKEVAKIDKRDEIKKKILDGKIMTYFKEKTLPDQIFIKNEQGRADQTVGELLEKAKAEIKEVKRYSI